VYVRGGVGIEQYVAILEVLHLRTRCQALLQRVATLGTRAGGRDGRLIDEHLLGLGGGVEARGGHSGDGGFYMYVCSALLRRARGDRAERYGDGAMGCLAGLKLIIGALRPLELCLFLL
jgi:hypothetical protein